MESSTKIQRLSQLCGLAVIITLAIVCYRYGILSSVTRMQGLVQTAGIWGPIIFIGLQIIQVIFPIIPGGMTTVAAVSIFGPFWGFVYNYIGVSSAPLPPSSSCGTSASGLSTPSSLKNLSINTSTT